MVVPNSRLRDIKVLDRLVFDKGSQNLLHNLSTNSLISTDVELPQVGLILDQTYQLGTVVSLQIDLGYSDTFDTALLCQLEEQVDDVLVESVFGDIDRSELLATPKNTFKHILNVWQFRICNAVTHLKLLEPTHITHSANESISHRCLVDRCI